MDDQGEFVYETDDEHYVNMEGNIEDIDVNVTLLEIVKQSGNFTSILPYLIRDSIHQNTTNGGDSSSFFLPIHKAPMYRMTAFSVTLCSTLGCLSLVLNLFVIFALIRNRRRVLKNVFYVIVLHCALLDVIRGSCLILYGFPTLLSNHLSLHNRVTLLKVSQNTLVVLRACNLLTIFNLLVFTTNEFIVIRYPLHYRRYFRRRTALLILLCCWIISIVFGFGSSISAPPARLTMINGTLTRMESKSEEGRIGGIEISTISLLMIFSLCYLCLFIVLICYSAILRTIRRFHNVEDKGQFNSDDSHRIFRNTIGNKEHKEVLSQQSTVTCTGSAAGKRVDSGRRWRSHLMSRHKYLIVIGSVLFVDVLFLFPYSGIQLVAFLHLNNYVNASHNMTFVRWGLQILIGIHSVCQPLCYFRMTEFRRLACCNPRRYWNRTKSFSQIHKSFANTRSVMAGEDEGEKMDGSVSPNPNDPLLKHPKLKILRQAGMEWQRTESVKFRTYGNHVEHRKFSDPGTTTMPPSVMEMEAIRAEIDMDLLKTTTFHSDNTIKQN